MSRKIKHIQECNNNLEKRFLNEKSSDLRNYMREVGWTEKGTELSSGGEITDELSNVIKDLISSATTIYNCKGRFTAGNDKYHKNRKSRHNKGQAVDVTMDQSCHRNFKELLNTFVKKYPGFSYIDEYENPSKGSTGGHFHISYSKGSPETNSSYNSSYEFDNLGNTSNSSDISGSSTENDTIKQMLGSVLFPTTKKNK